jgi:hypothetical protein
MIYRRAIRALILTPEREVLLMRRISQKEEYRIVHAGRFEPVMTDEVEAKVVNCFHWWPIAELAGASERLTGRARP